MVLKLASPLPNQAEAGTVLEFEGTPDSFTRSPFTLTLNLDPAKLEGWPAAPPARVRK